MRRTTLNISRISCALLFLACGGTLSSTAQTAYGSTVSAQPANDWEAETTLLRDFIHFVKIARFDVAADLGRQLIDAGLTPEEFVDLVDASRELGRFEEARAAFREASVIDPRNTVQVASMGSTMITRRFERSDGAL